MHIPSRQVGPCSESFMADPSSGGIDASPGSEVWALHVLRVDVQV
jgi:hypothetical protein